LVRGLRECAIVGLINSIIPPPETVAEAFIDCLRLLAAAAELGWVRRAGGVTSVLTKVPVGTRRLEVGESRLHAELAGAAFEAPPDLFATIITETTLARPAVRGYVARSEESPSPRRSATRSRF
jgi:hypothetical protein